MPDDHSSHLSPLGAFLATFRKDIETAAVRPLTDYLARFPGDDAAIEREYRAAIRGGFTTEPRITVGLSADRIGHYKILHQIGRGGQGTVYLAEDTRLHRQVALKVMDPGFASDAIAVERFKREAEITSKLDHSGICTVFETGEDRGALWIAMRYVEGDSLAKRVSTAKEGQASGSTETFVVIAQRDGHEGAPAPPPASGDRTGPRTWADISRLLALFEDAARALHVAHEVGVIHRDIKPANLIVTKDGAPVILDFGLAQDVAGEHPTLTIAGDMMGTPAYMSPEQIAAHRIKLDRRTDVYSLGVSLYECLTLRRPFDAPTRDGLYQAIMTKQPHDLRKLNSAIPSDLRVVVATAIEKDRDRRYQTALALAEDLRRVRVHEPIVARPAGPIVRLRRWFQRNPALATAVTGLFVVLAAGLVSTTLLWRAATEQRDDATRERDAKEAALADVRLERDAVTMRRLRTEASSLWPASPANVGPLRRWLGRAEDIVKCRDRADLIRMLEHLRLAAEPYSDADLAADAKLRETQKPRREAIERRQALLQEELDATEDADVAERIRKRLEALHQEAGTLDGRATWRLPDDGLQTKHDTIADFVTDLVWFLDPDPFVGELASIRKRHAFARTVEQESIGKHGARWKEAIDSIRDQNQCKEYGGLVIRPQVGLIPIGRDAKSGLWEFVHLQTAADPSNPLPRTDAKGHIEATEGMGLVFVLLPGGTFLFGTEKPGPGRPPGSPNVETGPSADDGPILSVTLDPFFMSKYEMTQGQWLRFNGGNPSFHQCGRNEPPRGVDLRHPVEWVNWEDSKDCVQRLGLSLPTEAQWEYAARAGTTTKSWYGQDPESKAKSANHADRSAKRFFLGAHWDFEDWDDGYAGHAPVGTFAPNPFGLHDVLGNVSEWCADNFAPLEPSRIRPGDGLTLNGGHRPVNRGGGYSTAAAGMRVAYRRHTDKGHVEQVIGLRPACRVQP